ncbi:phosphoesterase [Paraflavitalea soli]|uniref:Phosphoesterase n=1 Tax=Paraflavitalea soli TaxID=2315862 RepID=A0A3B7MR22_9BACT|nr:metallophosphoesterase [Paraflavitalea soli]AXY73031.1 phosphoesterase [Paraflavitalea soli]
MTTYVMGDIHGGHKALLQCLQRSGFDYERDTLIQLGDIADGYDEVFACVETLLTVRHLVAIKGNHDDWFQTFIRTGFHPQYWNQGGEGTLRSYLIAAGKQDLIPAYGNIHPQALNPPDIPATHRHFFNHQRLYYLDDHMNCFVHAGFDRRLPFREQLPHLYYWDRELWLEALSWEATNRGKKRPARFKMATRFHEVFIGHTRTIMWGTDQPMKAANVNNIDTGGGGGGRLTIMNVETKECWQSDPVNSLYEISYR